MTPSISISFWFTFSLNNFYLLTRCIYVIFFFYFCKTFICSSHHMQGNCPAINTIMVERYYIELEHFSLYLMKISFIFSTLFNCWNACVTIPMCFLIPGSHFPSYVKKTKKTSYINFRSCFGVRIFGFFFTC